MAERRMFAKTIIDSDAFLEMPVTAQLLYFHMAMRADDDGFINKPKAIMRMCGGKEDDMKLLIAKKFVIPFESGVVVIKHWKIHNYIRKDTYAETKYKEEKSLLETDENNSYRLLQSSPLRIRDESVTGQSTQDRLGKDRLGKDSIGEREYKDLHTQKVFGSFSNVYLDDEQLARLKEECPLDYERRIERLSKYIASSGKTYDNHLAVILRWAEEEYSYLPEGGV